MRNQFLCNFRFMIQDTTGIEFNNGDDDMLGYNYIFNDNKSSSCLFKIGKLASVVEYDSYGMYDEAPFVVKIGRHREYFSLDDLKTMMDEPTYEAFLNYHDKLSLMED